MRLVPRCLSAGLCILALVACAKTEHVDKDGLADRSYDQSDKSGTTTVTGANVGGIASSVAVDRIVAARCSRELACNNVGPDKHFTNHDVCADQLRGHVSAELTPGACARGIDEVALDKCMEAIRTESCNNPVETIERLAMCRTGELCQR